MFDPLNSLDISLSPYVKAVVTFLLVVIIAKAFDLVANKVFVRFVHITETDLDDRLLSLFRRPLLFTIIVVGAFFSISYIEVAEKSIFYIQGVLYTMVVIIWYVTFIRISNLIIEFVIRKESDVTGLKKDIIPFVENISKIILFVVALTVILSLWRVNITPLIASAGIAGAAVAFAAKDTIANFFGGISLFVDKPFKIGDYIMLDQGDRGEVVSIGIRSTRIKTRDDILISVPNSIIANTKIINESAPVPKFRVRIPVSVSYGSDIDQVEALLLGIASENTNVVHDPEPRVRFRSFGDSALNIELLCWAKEPSLRGRTIHELNSEIYKRFNDEGIKIPFPQRDVHIYEKKH
jgi:small-conductance mechanosensitive channel